MKKAIGFVFAVAVIATPGLIIAERYERPFLSCVARYPVVSLGNAGRFHVVTNVAGPFMWVAESEEYGVYDAGSQFVTPFTRLGLQQVAVVWGSKRASCFVEVVPAPGFGEPYAGPSAPILYDGSPHHTGPNVTLTSSIYPSLPNAGFAPQTYAGFAFAAVLLFGASIALYSYVRKAFTIVAR